MMIAIVAALMLCLALTVFLGRLILRAFGKWLLVADPLEPASCVVVLGGYFPWRVLEAASLYHQGWAPEVWLTQRQETPERQVFAKLGIDIKLELEHNQHVLKRVDVPTHAVSLIEEPCVDTAAELRNVALKMQARGITGPIILVTSKAHARRVKILWKALVGRPKAAIVRYTPDDPFVPDRWFLNPRDAQTVAHESFAILNAWTGFPIKPKTFAAPAPASYNVRT